VLATRGEPVADPMATTSMAGGRTGVVEARQRGDHGGCGGPTVVADAAAAEIDEAEATTPDPTRPRSLIDRLRGR
jgi:hypothetical protein